MNGYLLDALKRKKGPDIFETVEKAAATGNTGLVRRLLLADRELVHARYTQPSGLTGEPLEDTPLHWACMKGDVETARLLLDYGALTRGTD